MHDFPVPVPMSIVVLYLDMLQHLTEEHKRSQGRRKTYIT